MDLFRLGINSPEATRFFGNLLPAHVSCPEGCQRGEMAMKINVCGFFKKSMSEDKGNYIATEVTRVKTLQS